MLNKLKIIKPDDWHLHIREGELMKKVLPFTYNNFSRALIMPNLKKPVFTKKDALKYKKNIIKCLPISSSFKPLLTIYLNEKLDFDDLKSAFEEKVIYAVKYYPKGATTNSSKGVDNLNKVMPILEKMCLNKIPLCIHGEANEENIDIFDREKFFLDNQLKLIIKEFPELRITLEHITTKEAVSFITETTNNIKASITLHHLLINRNDIFQEGIRPHYFCLPIAKREIHRQKLLEVALSGNENFFLGTDSAPHVEENKLSECGCAGIFTSPVTLECLIQIFENYDSLENLEKFISINGANHYNIGLNQENLTFYKSKTPVLFPKRLKIGDTSIKIFEPNFDVFWKKFNEKGK